ncbi:MAG: hypothetical protein KatS3mg111_3756 [Pirellulaceae bacterium]|nr:MAG: hypothetical protein KatS3mg111_3756 [Pirellulaceae bacterium]
MREVHHPGAMHFTDGVLPLLDRFSTREGGAGGRIVGQLVAGGGQEKVSRNSITRECRDGSSASSEAVLRQA